MGVYVDANAYYYLVDIDVVTTAIDIREEKLVRWKSASYTVSPEVNIDACRLIVDTDTED